MGKYLHFLYDEIQQERQKRHFLDKEIQTPLLVFAFYMTQFELKKKKK